MAGGDSDTDRASVTVGVGAVVFRDDRVLVIRRGKDPFRGAWSIPGGRLEPGERIGDAILREILEETGVCARLAAPLGVFEALPDETGGRHVVMIDWVAEWVSGEPTPGDDADAAEFVPFDEALARIAWDVTRNALQEARAIRRALDNAAAG